MLRSRQNPGGKPFGRLKGSVLLASSWMLVIFSLLATSIGFRSGIEARVLSNHLDQTAMFPEAMGGLHYAQALIESDPEPEVDSQNDSWRGAIQLAPEVSYGERLEINVEDEESKININKAPPNFLKEFLRLLGKEGVKFETKIEDIVSGIVFWRGGSWIKGKSSLEFEPKRRPFESLDELYLIPFISKEDINQLTKYLTVYGSTQESLMKLNIHTADPLILQALISSLAGDYFAKEELTHKILEWRKSIAAMEAYGNVPQPLSPLDLTPINFMAFLQLTNSVQMISLVNQLLRHVGTDSQFFSLQIKVTSARNGLPLDVRLILGPRVKSTNIGLPLTSLLSSPLTPAPLAGPKTENLEVLYWHEEIY